MFTIISWRAAKADINFEKSTVQVGIQIAHRYTVYPRRLFNILASKGAIKGGDQRGRSKGAIKGGDQRGRVIEQDAYLSF